MFGKEVTNRLDCLVSLIVRPIDGEMFNRTERCLSCLLLKVGGGLLIVDLLLFLCHYVFGQDSTYFDW